MKQLTHPLILSAGFLIALVVGHQLGSAQPSRGGVGIRWEYEVVELGSEHSESAKDWTEKLSQYGAKGWELYQFVPRPEEKSFLYGVLRRQIP